MRRAFVAIAFAVATVIGVEAAPTDVVTQADLQAILERMAKLEAENKAQAARIAELEATGKVVAKKLEAAEMKVTEETKKFELQTQKLSQMAQVSFEQAEGTTTNETGRIYTTAQGFKYYLADVSARIFEPLSESGLKITPYGYLVFEGVYNSHGTESDYYSDWVKSPHSSAYGDHTSTLSMQDSILGMRFETPEAHKGWKFVGLAECDLAGGDANDYAFHWRHLYFDAQHESGWSILFGQTWHLWKMVTPSDIDGAWLEQTGHPYRRSPQLSVRKKWNYENDKGEKDSSLEVRFGIVKGGPGMGGDRDLNGTQDNSASAWPLFEAAVVYDHDSPWQDENDLADRRWLVGIGGMYGQDRAHNFCADGTLGDNEDYDSSLIMLAGKIPFGNFTLNGQIFAGQNLSGIQAGIGQGVGYDEHGRGRAVRTIGGFLDLAYQLNADWSFAVGYGFDNPNDTDAQYAEGRLFNDRAYIDAFYQVTDNFKLGVQYARLSTKWYDEGTGYSDRVQFSAFYDF